MKIKTSRGHLLKLLQLVAGASQPGPLPILGHVLICAIGDTLSVTCYDTRLQLRACATGVTITEEGSTTVNVKKLMEICKGLPGASDVSLALDDDRLIFKAGRSRFSIATLPPADFPDVGELATPVSIELHRAELRRIMGKVAYCMGVKDVRYYLNGMCLHASGPELVAVSTDGHRMGMARAAITPVDHNHQIIVPTDSAHSLISILAGEDAPITLQMGSNHLRTSLMVSDNVSLEFTTSLVNGQFPDYKRVIPRHDNAAIVHRDDLIGAVQRATIMAPEKTNTLRLQFTLDQVILTASNANLEQATEDVGSECSAELEEIGASGVYMREALQNTSGESAHIGFGTSSHALAITSPIDMGTLHILMPYKL